MYYRKISIVTKVFLPLAVLLGLWMLFNLCFCQDLGGADLNRTGADGHESNNPVPMVDTFHVLNPDIKDVRTGHGFNGTRKGNKIDYIFTPSNVKVVEAEILYDNVCGRYPSDHFPVTAILDLPANSEH